MDLKFRMARFGRMALKKKKKKKSLWSHSWEIAELGPIDLPDLTPALNSKLKSKGLSSFEEELLLVVVSVMLQWLNLLLQLVILFFFFFLNLQYCVGFAIYRNESVLSLFLCMVLESVLVSFFYKWLTRFPSTTC